LSGLFLIVGLGNPGSRYSLTRHNAGFWFLDVLHKQLGAGVTDSGFRLQAKVSAEICRGRLYGKDCILAKPTVFMNHSGQAVRALVDYYQVAVENVLIAYDDLDLVTVVTTDCGIYSGIWTTRVFCVYASVLATLVSKMPSPVTF
jgi:PTH1 family peptidyl-tRNA hydrolase